MSINVSEMIWTIICFFALLLVLKVFLFDPLTRHMDERQRRIEAGRDEKRRAEAAKSEARRAAEESWHARNDEARAALEQGAARAAGRRADELEETQRRSEQLISNARTDAGREEEESRAAVARDADELARALADRLLGGGEER